MRKWLSSKVTRPSTPRCGPCPSSSTITSPSIDWQGSASPPVASPDSLARNSGVGPSDGAATPGGGGFTGVVAQQSAARRRSGDGADTPNSATGIVQKIAQHFVCSGKSPRASSPPTADIFKAPDIATPQATWAQQREAGATDVAKAQGCFPQAAFKAFPPWRRSASASRQAADRFRQRRRGSKGVPTRSTIGSSPSEASVASPTLGAMMRSQSAPPLALIDDAIADSAFFTPQTPAQASPLPMDVPTPSLFGLGLCTPNSLSVAPDEQRLNNATGLDLASYQRGQMFPPFRCCSAPPTFHSPPPAAVPSPGRLSLSPGPLPTRASFEKVHDMPFPEKLSPANSTSSPSTIPPLPAMPHISARPKADGQSTSPASPNVMKQTPSPQCKGTVKPEPSPMIQKKVAIPALPRNCSWSSSNYAGEANQATPAGTSFATVVTSPCDTEGADSPNLLQRLQRQGLWPLDTPQPNVASAAKNWAWLESESTDASASDIQAAKSQHTDKAKAGDDPRMREAQELLAKMLAGGEAFGERARRRHGSAPPLSSPMQDAALAPEIASLGGCKSGKRTVGHSSSKVGVRGLGSSVGTALRREATAPPLRPLNGSMPYFPAAELRLDAGR